MLKVERAGPLLLSTPVGTAAGGRGVSVKVETPPLVATAATGAQDCLLAVLRDAPVMRGAAVGRVCSVSLLDTVADSITEAVLPLDCSIRLKMASSTSLFVATLTERQLAHKESTPRMGKLTASLVKVHSKVRQLMSSCHCFRPQQAMGWPLGQTNLGVDAGGSCEEWGIRLRLAPVSTR